MTSGGPEGKVPTTGPFDGVAFLGYPRGSGRAGVRNYVLVLGINGLVAASAERIGCAIAGACVVATPYGRGQYGPDRDIHFKQLIGIGANPNVGATLIIGADRNSADRVANGITAIRKDMAIKVATLDDVAEDAIDLTARGARDGAELARLISRARREVVPLCHLFVAMECGHSDATSGVASNPLVGAVADRLVDAGATVVIGETLEWLGAEHVLRERAANEETASAIVKAVKAREAAVTALGDDLLGNNPGEENIRGGLSTIEEKSLGAIAKSGTRSIRSLLAFAERPASSGLHVMDGPSYSPESMTGFVAAGAQLTLFTTGSGNAYASLLAPTMKISANAQTVARLGRQVDLDASPVFAGFQPLEEAADAMLARLVDFASGTCTWGEILCEGRECFHRVGGSL